MINDKITTAETISIERFSNANEATNKDEAFATGTVTIEHYDGDGNKIDTKVNNMIVTAGKNFITSRMKDTTKAAMTHMALGSDATAAVAGNTALGTQIGSRKVLDSTTVSNNIITYVATFGPTVSTGSVYEAGLFNASTAGDMLARTTFGLTTKTDADTFIITWAITIS